MDNLGTLLAHNAWQSIIIFGIVFAVLKMIKNTSAEEKSWSWSATLLALALLPLAAFLPGKGIELEQRSASIVASIEETATATVTPIEKAPPKAKTKVKFTAPSEFSLPKFDKNDLLTAFLIIWSVGTGVALLRLTYAGHNASKLRNGAYPYAGMDDQNWPHDVEVAVSDKINGPIVIGVFKPLILIPRSFAFEMAQDELKPLLYHELAHVKRRDNLLHFVERIIIAFYWWNPIMHYIAARIAEERELACDDRAAHSCGDNLVYAKSLLKGARKLMGNDRPVLGLAVLRRESVLSKRVKRMTMASALQGLDAKRLLKNLSALSMAILLLCLITPRIAVGQDALNRSELNSVEMAQEGYFLEVEWKGNIDIDDLDAEVLDLSDNGYFSLVTEENGERKELIFSHDGEAIDSRFLENGTERNMTAEDMIWQRHAMVDMLRLSGINAEKRVDRIYKEGGAEEVIDEIELMHSDYATRLYTEALVDIYELEQDEIQQLIMITGDMVSDYEKGLTLASIADEQDLEGETAELLASMAPADEEFHTLIEFEQISEQEREEIKREIEEQLANLPTEEELEQIRQEALDSLPSSEELEEMRREALESIPTEQEMAEMRAEALANIPSAEELAEMRAEAMASIPSEEELAEMMTEAMKGFPTAEELTAIREQAIEGIPTEEELTAMMEDAMKDFPTEEELAAMMEDAMKDFPTEEELQQMRKDIEENMLSEEELERIRKELKEQLENLPELESLDERDIELQEKLSEFQLKEHLLELKEHQIEIGEQIMEFQMDAVEFKADQIKFHLGENVQQIAELSAVMSDQMKAGIELSLAAEEMARIKAEIAKTLSEEIVLELEVPHPEPHPEPLEPPEPPLPPQPEQ